MGPSHSLFVSPRQMRLLLRQWLTPSPGLQDLTPPLLGRLFIAIYDKYLGILPRKPIKGAGPVGVLIFLFRWGVDRGVRALQSATIDPRA